MMRSSVVLPEPDGPEQRDQLARRDVRLTSSSAAKRAEALADVLRFDAHALLHSVHVGSDQRRPRRHSTIGLTTSVTSARHASSDATANAAAKLYSL